MEKFVQAVGLILLTVILALSLRKNNPEFAILLSLAACCITALAMLGALQEVLAFLQRLQQIGQLDVEMVSILFKVVGIALITEIASSICTDCGNVGMGKMLQLLSGVVILGLSIPMLTKLMDLVETILRKL